MPDPGLRFLVSPTHDWRDPAPDAFHWVKWTPRDDGMVDRVEGFAATFAIAEQRRISADMES